MSQMDNVHRHHRLFRDSQVFSAFPSKSTNPSVSNPMGKAPHQHTFSYGKGKEHLRILRHYANQTGDFPLSLRREILSE
jgi:hypothetical protein